MQQKLLLLILIISTTSILSSCQKEVKNDDASTLKMAQTKSFNPQDIQTTALQSRAMSEKIFEQLNAKMQLVQQNIKNLLSERRERFGHSSAMEKENPGQSVIHIPADYPTLQEAVDHATTNGKILVKGSVSDIGSVVVDKTGLTIQGEEDFSIINGNKLIITAAGVTVQNLNIQMAIEISGTSNATLMNNDISAPNNTGVSGIISSINSNHITIKNCNVNGALPGGNYEYGIYLDDLSNNDEVVNCKVENTSFSAFLLYGTNNTIKNCSALNFNRGFSAFSGGVSKNNQLIGCVANNSYNDAGFVFFLPDSSNLKLQNCTANKNKTAGFFIFGGTCKVSNCTANSNDSYGIEAILNDFIIEKSSFRENKDVGVVLYDLGFGTHKGTLDKNEVLFNAHFGIYMWGMNNSAITKNEAKNNPVCDFNQKDCNSNTVTRNQFGTSCTGL